MSNKKELVILVPMKRVLLSIILILNLLCLNAQEVKFISVNESIDSIENITFKRFSKLLQKDTLRPDTLTTPAKWMLKLQKKLSKQQDRDTNIYIFFCPSSQDSVTAYLPLSGKYGYVLFDTAKTDVVAIQTWQKRISIYKYQWDLIHDPQKMVFAWKQSEEEGALVDEGPISEVTRFINTIKCAKQRKLSTINIHHAVNSYIVKVGDLLEQLNIYRGSSTLIAGDDFKKTYLKVYIDEGMFSSASDFYLGYHNFQLSVNDYERKPAQGIYSENLIFTANGKPIIFSFPIGTDADIQMDVLNWIERECGIKTGGTSFKNIRFNIETDNIEDLFSLSICQLEQLDKEDRKKLIRKALNNVHNFLNWDKDTYQYLLANLITSTPKKDVGDLTNYLSSIGDELEIAYLDLAATARDVFIISLCEIAKKSWDETEYLGKLNSYLLGVQALIKDEFNQNRVTVGMCGVFDITPGIYKFSRTIWLSKDGKYPYNDIKPEDSFEISAFDPVESHIIGSDNSVDETVIYPAIVTKILATQLHIANIDHLLEIPKMVLLPEVTANIFAAVPRVGATTTKLLKQGISVSTNSLSKMLGKCGELGYKIKKSGTQIALYTNLNIEIARFSGTGKLMTKVYPHTKTGARILSWEDEIEYITTVNTTKKGKLELAKTNDGVIFFRELAEVGGRFIAKSGTELKTFLNSLSEIPTVEKYSGNFYRTVGNGRDPLLTHYIPKGKSQRYSNIGEDGLFFSSSKEGNFQELKHWDVPIEGNTTTFIYINVESKNLLDLTNLEVRKKMGISLEQITGNSYEFTDVIGSWSRKNNYKGIIYPSARGTAGNKYFVNIILFDSGTANKVIQGKTIEKMFN